MGNRRDKKLAFGLAIWHAMFMSVSRLFMGDQSMPVVKKQFSLSSEQVEFISFLVKKKAFKDKSQVVRSGIELLRQRFQEIELEEMAREYSADESFIQTGKRGIKLQNL